MRPPREQREIEWNSIDSSLGPGEDLWLIVWGAGAQWGGGTLKDPGSLPQLSPPPLAPPPPRATFGEFKRSTAIYIILGTPTPYVSFPTQEWAGGIDAQEIAGL